MWPGFAGLVWKQILAALDMDVRDTAELETCATLGQHVLAEAAGTYSAVRMHNGI